IFCVSVAGLSLPPPQAASMPAIRPKTAAFPLTARSMVSPWCGGWFSFLLSFQDETEISGSQVVLLNSIQSNTSCNEVRAIRERIDSNGYTECERPPTSLALQIKRLACRLAECQKMN